MAAENPSRPPRFHPPLVVGERFYFHGDSEHRPHEVVRTSPCSAVVRSSIRVRREIETREGEKVEFSAPSGTFQISLHSMVVRIGEES